MENLARRYHKGQYRNKKKIPYIEHLIGVRSILSSVLEITRECENKVLLEDILDAAIGHDLIEDTSVSKDEIVAFGNKRVLNMVKELSNPVDDSHTDEYMKQLSKATEEVRIIKYCDLLENTTSVCYGLQDLGLDWARNFYIPILKDTTRTLANTVFTQYPNTALLLRGMLKVSSDLLFNKINLAGEGDKE